MVKNKSRGFTLIELMIVVVIVAILAAVAYPSYRNQVIKGNRAAAESYLMALAARQEQYMLDARSYATTVGAGAGGLNFTAPPEVANHYQAVVITLGGTPPTFTLTATPIPGDMQASDGDLWLKSDGSKSANWK